LRWGGRSFDGGGDELGLFVCLMVTGFEERNQSANLNRRFVQGSQGIFHGVDGGDLSIVGRGSTILPTGP
jgi:hypothetical protein